MKTQFLGEREPFKCIAHAAKLSDWAWDANTPNRLFDDYINQSGLHVFKSISYRRANRIVISAFVERWQPETNTFHIPFGEMTITLNDVPTLVGITVMGRSISRPRRLTDAKDVLVNLLDVSEQDAREKFGLVCGSSVRLEWLHYKFSYVTDAHSERWIQCAARAYLLYLVGCTLFSDKSETRVSIKYLQLFEVRFHRMLGKLLY